MTTQQLVSPVGVTYARSRLWLGITGVGLQVVLALTMLFSSLPEQLGMVIPSSLGAELGTLVLLLFISASIQLPFDFFGGYLFPTQYGRNSRSAQQVFLRLLLSAFIHTALLTCFAALYLMLGKLLGVPAMIAAYIGVAVLLVVAQGAFASLVGTFKVQRAATALTLPGVSGDAAQPLAAQVLDTSFVGGVVLDGISRRAIVPAFWADKLSDTTRSFALTRRGVLLANRSAFATAVPALCFNLLGLVLFLWGTSSTEASAAFIIKLSAWSTIWAFLGLLVLPSLNRPAVFALDSATIAGGISTGAASAAILELDKLQEEEPARSLWVERIFHPIPSASSRVEALSAASPTATHWLFFHQLVRRMLYLSWGNLNLLARSVHCNVGKPECWVLFPGD